ncbi:DUF1592 domain-containing protein [Rubinisphaera italica]|uniref:Planctomycete cytochrome C n=1 Tax=Rubinisphaera italica TaxID=2527969 RepID=A0A5C5XG93_9PLAN|nr:DUF1592 domain-containing protein [Rubinisphaera italica]TWT62067.1 Planctomycete cytochrome C [Rubinisphaera italica]
MRLINYSCDLSKALRLLIATFVGFVMHQNCLAIDGQKKQFLATYCSDCHTGSSAEAGLEIESLSTTLTDAGTFAVWERIYDRVNAGEMPPKDAEQPTSTNRLDFQRLLHLQLSETHRQSKGTVLRRLNRREYENTLNDIFGTNLNLEEMLPEDGRSHEFDNVGSTLGLSMVHMQSYIDAMSQVLDAAIAKTVDKPTENHIEASYKGSGEGDKFIGKVWKELSDGSVVRFEGGGYPSGMMRGSGVREPGRYKVKVNGYAYRSETPITFSVGGTSFQRGSEKPTYGYFSFKPGTPENSPQSIEFEAWIESNYMIEIEPYGISDPNRYKRENVDEYQGPGLAIHSVILDGPLAEEFPSRGHKLIFEGLNRTEIQPGNPKDKLKSWYRPRFEIQSINTQSDVSNSLMRIAEAAFRKPVQKSEIDVYLTLFHSERDKGNSFEDALRTAATAIFCSPRFLFLKETSGQLDDYALASRLSYFLTRTTPDAELLRLAEAGQLSKPDILRQQTERLLTDPRFSRFLTDFTEAWLNLREMDFTVPDSSLFPEYDNYLRYSMPLETEAFLQELIAANLPIQNLIKSDFAMLNSRLATHYELPDVAGAKVQKVKLPANHLRGGLLTQASILKVSANGTNSSPVVRGVWVMERILGETPSPPPPGIPGVEPDIRGASTLRELLDKHRSLANCQPCHNVIDPPGFALESFNPIGGYRERYRSLGEGERVNKQVNGRGVRYRLGPEVDPSGQLADGRNFDNYLEFRELLASKPEILARAFTEKLLTFATGRELGFSDREEIDIIVGQCADSNYGMKDLLHQAISSDIFQQK